MRRLVLTLVAAGALAVATFAGVAGAAPVPPSGFTCGVTVFTPCNQSAHFSQLDDVLTPLAPTGSTNCPSYVVDDFATAIGTGNGVEHSIINNAGDGWFTSTFTGNATITLYRDPGLSVPDTSAGPFTGRVTEWFGGSFNRNNYVFHSTFHFSGTDASGQTLNVQAVQHENSTGSSPFTPVNSFTILSCS